MWPAPWYPAGRCRRRPRVKRPSRRWRRRVPLAVEALEDRTLLSAAGPFATATPILLDLSGAGSQSGTLAAARQVDYYQFRATYTGELTIRQSADGSRLDSQLSVYDGSSPQPRLLASNDDLPDNGTLPTDNNGNIVPNLDSLVHVAVVAGQTYYVEAAASPGAAPGKDTGAYVLTFGGHDGGTAFADAQPIPLDTTNAGSTGGTLAVSGDVGVYQFTAQATGGVTIGQAAANGGSLDSTLVVFDATGRQIAFNDDSNGTLDSQVQVAVDAGQTYYVEAAASPSALPGTDTGDYQLTVAPVPDDVPNTLADAQAVTLDASGAATQDGSIDYPGDVDAFRFRATATGRLTIQQQAAPDSSLDSLLVVYDAAGRPITFNDDNGTGNEATTTSVNSRVTFDVVQGRWYFVRAGASTSPDSSRETGAYQLTFATDAAAPGDQGHVFDRATPLTPDASGSVRHFGTIAAPGQNDFYRFTAAQSGPLVVRQEALAGGIGLHTFLYLFDGNGQLLAFSVDPGGTNDQRQFDAYHADPADPTRYDFFHASAAEEIASYPTTPDFNFSQVQFDATAGHTYYLVATAFRASIGDYALTIQPAGQGGGLDDALPLALDATGAGHAYGVLALPSSRQTYTFTAPVTGQVLLQATATSSSPLDTTLTVFDATGRQVGFNDDINYPSNTNSQVLLKVIAGQAYTLAVSGFALQTGSYRLTVTPAVDPFGSDLDSATDLTAALDPDGSGSVSGVLFTPGRSDFFRFTAPVTGSVAIREAAAAGSALDAYLTIYDGNRQPLTFNDDSNDTTDSFVRFDVTAGQTYYVQAGAFGDSTGAYDLTLTGAAGPGHSFAEAQEIRLGRAGAGSADGSIDTPGDSGYFRFTARADGLVVITQEAASGSALDSVLTVYDATPQHAQVAFNDDVNYPTDLNSALSFPVTAGTTYYVVAAGYGSSTGAYRITLTPVVPGTYGTDFASATDVTASVPAGGSGSLVGTVAAAGDTAFLRFTAPANEGLTIREAALPGSSLDAYLRVYDAARGLLTFNDDGGGGGNGTDSLVRFNVTAGQTYYVQAGAFGDSTGAYVLTFTGGSRLVDGFGHTFADAQAIPLDATGAGSAQGTIVNPADQDFFRFTAPATGVLSVTQAADTGSSLDSVLSVYDATPQHNQLARNDDASAGTRDSALQLAVTAGQTYYVLAAGFRTSTGAFHVTIAPVASDDYGSDFTTATDITASLARDGSGTVVGAVEAPGSEDFLRFTAAVTGPLTIEQDAAAGSRLDSTLTVFDASQNQLASDDDINYPENLNSRVQINVVAGQTYYVEAAASPYAAPGTDTGAYTLLFTTDMAGAPGGTLDTAIVVALDAAGSATVTGTLTGAQDGLFYRFTAPADGRMLAEENAAPGSPLDSYLYVFNGSGQQIASDDDSAGGLDSLAEFPVVAGQTYTVEASAFDGSTGAFTLTLAAAAGRLRHTFADALDLLPRSDDPTAASAAGFADATGSITAAGDVDFFRFTAPFTGGAEVRLQALPGSRLDGILFAYDSTLAADGTAQHNLLAHARGRDVVLRLAVRAGQTYFVEAAGAAASTGDYALALTPVPDDFGNDFNHAEPLPLDAADAGSQAGSIEVPGDVDVFRFVAPASGTLTVALGPTGGSALLPVLSAFDGSQQPIALRSGAAGTPVAGKPVQLQFAVDAGRTYYVEAAGFGSSTGGYTLSLHDPVGAPATGPLDFASARPASLSFVGGTAAVPVLGPLDAGEVEFIRFRAPVTGPLAIASPGADAALDVFTFPDGFQGAAEQLTGDAQNAFAVQEGRTYFVRVTAHQASPNGYELTFTQVDLAGPAVDRRAGLATAGDLRDTFTTLRIQGAADPQQTADAISASLVQTFLAGLGGPVTGNYLLLWLDPVDFVVTDPQGRQSGNTPERVEVNQVPGSFYSNGGSTNALQLLILPDALASSYQLSLIGVGDGQVLAGARLITPDGTISPSTSLVFSTQAGVQLESVLDFSPQPAAPVTAAPPGTAVAQAGQGAVPASSPAAPLVVSQPASLTNAVAALLVNATVTAVTPTVVVGAAGFTPGRAAALAPTGGLPAPGPVGQSGSSVDGGPGGLAAVFGVVDRVFSQPIRYVAAEVSAEAGSFAAPGVGVVEGAAQAVGAALAPVEQAVVPVREVVLQLADGVLTPAVAEVKLLTQALRAGRVRGKAPATGKTAAPPVGRAGPPAGEGAALGPALAAVVFLSGAWYERPADEERGEEEGRR